MYYIEKIPAPRGYTNLPKKIKVDNVLGVDEVYTVDGELRGRLSTKINPEKDVVVEVVYTKNYSDGTTNDFVAIEHINNENSDFSLSKAPLISGGKKKILSIDILVRRTGEEYESSNL